MTPKNPPRGKPTGNASRSGPAGTAPTAIPDGDSSNPTDVRTARAVLDRALAGAEVKLFGDALRSVTQRFRTKGKPGANSTAFADLEHLLNGPGLVVFDRFHRFLARLGLRFSVAVREEETTDAAPDDRRIPFKTSSRALLGSLGRACLVVRHFWGRSSPIIGFHIAQEFLAGGRSVLLMTDPTYAFRSDLAVPHCPPGACGTLTLDLNAPLDLDSLRRQITTSAFERQISLVVIDGVRHLVSRLGEGKEGGPAVVSYLMELRALAEQLDLQVVLVADVAPWVPLSRNRPPRVEDLGLPPPALKFFDRFMLVNEVALPPAGGPSIIDPPPAPPVPEGRPEWLEITIYGWNPDDCRQFFLRYDPHTGEVTRRFKTRSPAPPPPAPHPGPATSPSPTGAATPVAPARKKPPRRKRKPGS
ncbi:MAG: hypothetical protein GX442_21770 [Candidatus Riflebacteria bacterium]|nr:hypothetical protein [Candidatus Riflebacteria bacterium]